MDDLESDLSKFTEDEDRIKPIDIGPAPPRPLVADQQKEAAAQDMAIPGALPPEPEGAPAPRGPDVDEDFEPLMVTPGGEEPNYIKRGEYIDLIEKVPTLKRLIIGGGWEQANFEGERVDIDLSLFLLNKHDQTRIDEDFIFYNNPRACDGAIQHRADSRTGAGLGDDETLFVDLNGLPFDILKIICVFSVYDPEIKGHNFSMVRELYLRIVNKDDGEEIFRYKLDEQDCQGGTAVIVGTLIREGPKWIYEASADVTNGGLAKVATDYGIIVKELQSTLDVDNSDSAPDEAEAQGTDSQA